MKNLVCAFGVLAGLVSLILMAVSLYFSLVYHVGIVVGEGNPIVAVLELVVLVVFAPILVYVFWKLITYQWRLK